MKNALLYFMGALLVSVACAAGYYSFAQSTSYIDINLGGSKTWYTLAVMAIVVEVLGLYMITQMLRIRQLMAFIAIPLILVLNVGAIGVSIYLEGGKATQVLSDARAARSIDATLGEGHKESLKQLLATQKKYIDSRRIDKARVNELNEKIKEQAAWAKQTAVSEINPMISMISKATNVSDKTVELSFVALVVLFPLLVKMLFGHIGLMLLTSPYRDETREPEKVPVPTPVTIEKEVTPEPTPTPKKVPPEPVREVIPTYDRLGSEFAYEDNIIKLRPRPKAETKRNSFHENKMLVAEFIEGCDLKQFTSTEGWELFIEQYPDTMNRNQFNSAINSLAKNRNGFRAKKVQGKKYFEIAA